MPDQTPEAAPHDDRDRSAEERDRLSTAHDQTARQRDVQATDRDARADARDSRHVQVDLDAATDRSASRRDRGAAGGDRRHARDDREAARTDRLLSARARADLLVDELTGAYRRSAGFLELEREIIKAERTQKSFVLAFLDVDDLKATNDSVGHLAGDHLLREVVGCVRRVIRQYDVLVRYGGDEFLCGMLDMSLAEVSARLDRANADLEERDHASVTIGLAEREPGEGLDSLLARADAAMYRARGLRRPGTSS